MASTHLGSSTYIRLNNVWSANAGIDYAFDQGDSAGLYLFYQERAADAANARREAMLYFNHKVTENWALRGDLLGGFSDGSPDYGAGMSARFSFQAGRVRRVATSQPGGTGPGASGPGRLSHRPGPVVPVFGPGAGARTRSAAPSPSSRRWSAASVL